MIHRRLLMDDGRGVGEPLNETDNDRSGLRQSVRHYILFEGDYRSVQKNNDQRILPFYAISSSNNFTKASIKKAPISVPDNVKLYIRPFEDGSYLVRFHNMNVKSKVKNKLYRFQFLCKMDGKSFNTLLLLISYFLPGKVNNLLGIRKNHKHQSSKRPLFRLYSKSSINTSQISMK